QPEKLKSMKKQPKAESSWPWILNYDLKMKLSFLLLTVMGFALHANTSYGQKTKISMNMGNATVEDVIYEIEAKTEFKFIFNINAVDLDRKVFLKVDRKPIAQVLDILFKNQPVSYEIDDRKILLRNTEEGTESKISPTASLWQQTPISGTVTDQDGMPLSGANIIEKGTTNGITADFDGKFTITPTGENAILEISYIGFATKEIPIDGQTTLVIVLQESAAS